MDYEEIADKYGEVAALLWTTPARNDAMWMTALLQELEIPVDADLARRVVALAERKLQEDRERDAYRVENVAHPRHDPIVYYMRQSDLVKIGTTTSIGQRLEAITPQGVMALEFGDHALEATRHKQFATSRDHGEWFSIDPPLAAHVADVRARFEHQQGMTVESWLGQHLRPQRRRSFSA